MSARKPHQSFAGYVAELRNKFSGGHTVISDCKRAADEGMPLVVDYEEEGGRYQVLCDEHGHLVYCASLPVARDCMKDPTTFCMVCRCIAGEGPENWEQELAPHDVAAVWLRRGEYLAKRANVSARGAEMKSPCPDFCTCTRCSGPSENPGYQTQTVKVPVKAKRNRRTR